jgi:hypothetical protein
VTKVNEVAETILARYIRLRSGADTGHRKTDVDGGADTAEEELGLQEDLAVCDGDNLYQICQYVFQPILT